MNSQALFGQALSAQRSGNIDEAARLCVQIMKRDKTNFVAMQMLGAIKAQQRQFEEAAELFRRALKFSRSPELFCNLGNVLHETGRHAAAIENYKSALNLKPNYGAALNGQGAALLALGQFDQAITCFDLAIAVNPRDVAALANRADANCCLGRHAAALESYEAALKIAPRDPLLHYSQAVVQQQLGRLGEAAASFGNAISLKPDYSEALYGQGTLFEQANDFGAALESYQRAIRYRPAFPDAYHRAGWVFQKLGRAEDALVQFEKAISLRPLFAEALNSKGVVLRSLNRIDEAIDSYHKAIAARPDYANAISNLGNALRSINRHDAAIQCYTEALRLKPDYAEAHNNLGIVQMDRRQFEMALDCFDRAIAIHSTYADAFYNRGTTLRELKRLDEAIASFETAAKLDPTHPYVAGALAGTALYACDWVRAGQFAQRLPGVITDPGLYISPFVLLSYGDDPALQRICAEQAVKRLCPKSAGGPVRHYQHQRLRVAYLSSDFNKHATAYLIAGLFERHDRTRFEVFALSYGPDDASALRQRIEKSVEHFIDVSSMRDSEIANLLEESEIDVAVDLNGHSVGARLGILSKHPCPVQITWLGCPATTGAGYIDYILGDAVVTPLEDQPHYAETIIQLPLCYQPSTASRALADTPDRDAHGLPSDGIVFCCFNSSWKITAAMFAIWMRILRQIPGSVLWLLADNQTAAENLRREAVQTGVEPDRLVFAPRVPSDQHLARHTYADIFLDTFPYNAHTTANDALFMGIPVVSLKGKSFQSRVAASLLTAVGLPELITESAEGYESLAVKLATDRGYLDSLRMRLASDTARGLFDEARFAKAIEDVFASTMKTAAAGQHSP